MSLPKEREGTQRRVYVLPTELVDRILQYQEEMALGSEVETVRRLLDLALKSRDTASTLIMRIKEKMKNTRDLREVAKDILVDHPFVNSINFDNSELKFTTKAGDYILINNSGKSTYLDENGLPIRFGRIAKGDEDIPF